MDAKGILMHIDRTNEVAVPCEAALTARPISASGLMTMPAARTPAAGSSFGAGEARDAGLLGFVGQVVDVASVFPLRHAAIVITATVPVAHAVWIADKERSHLLCDTEVDHLTGGFVPQVADAALGPATGFVFRPLQFLPAP